MPTAPVRALSPLLPIVVAILMTCWPGVSRGAEPSVWQPVKTRAFIVSLAQFQGGRLPSFSPGDRLDDRFVEMLKERGVPANQILFLKDQQATTQNIKAEFTNFLRQSRPGEMLLFYFGSHGEYDPQKAEYAFCTFNNTLSFTWALDAIERDFRGTHALLTTDCCYSGGIADLAARRHTNIAYACLSSTYAHQTAWSGWRFMQCLHRGLAGDPVVDLDNNGQLQLDELAAYTARYMAFAAEGKPTFATTGSFDAHLRLATTKGQKKPRAGELLEANAGAGWAKAEILDSAKQQVKVHFTKDTRSVNDAWVALSQVRPFQFERFPLESPVEVQASSSHKWYPGRVLKTWESLALCRYDGYSAAYDEWFGPSRIRAEMAGTWAGQWRNDVGESGPESLVLHADEDDTLHGTWSGNVNVKGERIGNDVIFFEGSTSNRRYYCAGWLDGPQLELNYCAHRNPDQGHYHGWASLLRTGEATASRRAARSEFAGNWVGTYENSREGSGEETLELSETDDRLAGVWSGVNVTGERLGDATFYLEGRLGKRAYRVVGRVIEGQLTLNYSAAESAGRYFGRSTLQQ